MIYKFKELDSTQKYLIENIDKYKVDDAIYALKQTNGYGRTGKWISNEENIYLSILKEPSKYPFLNTIYAMHKFARVYNKEIFIKIPNDLYFKDKKIGGFIIESINDKIVIGIGINIFLKEKENLTSLSEISNIDNSIDNLVKEFYDILLDSFEIDYDTLNQYFSNNTNILSKNISFIDKKTNTTKRGVVQNLSFDIITINNTKYHINQIKLLDIKELFI